MTLSNVCLLDLSYIITKNLLTCIPLFSLDFATALVHSLNYSFDTSKLLLVKFRKLNWAYPVFFGSAS